MTVVAAGKKTGTFSDVAEIVAARGWAGLYAGLRPSLLGTAVSQGVFFFLYSSLRDAAIGRATARAIGVTFTPWEETVTATVESIVAHGDLH